MQIGGNIGKFRELEFIYRVLSSDDNRPPIDNELYLAHSPVQNVCVAASLLLFGTVCGH